MTPRHIRKPRAPKAPKPPKARHVRVPQARQVGRSVAKQPLDSTQLKRGFY